MAITLFVVTLLGFALVGAFVAPQRADGKIVPLVTWLGASGGALIPLLASNCLLGFVFFLDPMYMLVQNFLLAGIVGGSIAVPSLLYQQIGTYIPFRKKVSEVGAVISIAGVMLILEIIFVITYKPAQVPF